MNGLLSCLLLLASVSFGMTVESFEHEVSPVFHESDALLRTEVTNRIYEACLSEDPSLRLSASLAKSAVEYQCYLNTSDRAWACRSVSTLTNVLTQCVALRESERYAVCSVLAAGNYAMLKRYEEAFCLSTNTATVAERCQSNWVTNGYLTSVFRFYKLDGLNVVGAAKYVAGMSAAELGLRAAATNFAEQVSEPFRQEILEFTE